MRLIKDGKIVRPERPLLSKIGMVLGVIFVVMAFIVGYSNIITGILYMICASFILYLSDRYAKRKWGLNNE
ncbi:MAG: hypothetical protein ABR515_02640 [Nitrososphaeraceae archaeon]